MPLPPRTRPPASRAPANARQFIDQTAVPAAINALGAAEAVIERIAVLTRRRPAPVLLAACLGAALAARLLLPRRT